jgi:hypothetical protein
MFRGVVRGNREHLVRREASLEWSQRQCCPVVDRE